MSAWLTLFLLSGLMSAFTIDDDQDPAATDDGTNGTDDAPVGIDNTPLEVAADPISM